MKTVRNMIDSSGRLLFVLFVLVSAFVFAMFQGGKVSWTIFYIILPFIIYTILLFFYPMSEMTVERTIRTPNVQNGEKLIVSLSIKRKSRFPLLYTVASEKWAEPEIVCFGWCKGQSTCLFLDFVKKLNGNMKLKKCPEVSIYFKG